MQSFPNTTNGRKMATAAIRKALKGAEWSDLEYYAVETGVTPQSLYDVQRGKTKAMFSSSLEKVAPAFRVDVREPKKPGRPPSKPSQDDMLVDIVDRFWDTRRQMDELQHAITVYLEACAH